MTMSIFGKGRAPASVAALVPEGERLMAWGTGPVRVDGEPTVVVATDKTFIAPGYLGPISWTDLARAEWSDTLLEVVTLRAMQGLEPPVRINLDEPGSVPQVVWERIESRIILQRHIELDGKLGARVIVKRTDHTSRPDIETTTELETIGVPPGIEDPVQWLVVFDAGIDAEDPKIRALVDAAVERLKSSTGI